MNRKLVSEFAVGVVLLIALIVGGIFWINNMREIAAIEAAEKFAQMSNNNIAAVKNSKTTEPVVKQVVASEEASEDNVCKPHYYEGEAGVDGWFVSESEDGIIIAIKKSDISKLPVVDYKISEQATEMALKLIDPTEEIEAEIKASSEKNPTMVKIQGYAEICEQPPLVSLKPATEAFKNRS